MSKAKKKKGFVKPKNDKDRSKLKIARELGLLDKLRREGWGGLSAQECGQVGGILSRMLKQGKKVPGYREKALGNAGPT